MTSPRVSNQDSLLVRCVASALLLSAFSSPVLWDAASKFTDKALGTAAYSAKRIVEQLIWRASYGGL